MAGIIRVHGAPAAEGFYGLPFKVVKITRNTVFTADSTNATTGEITEGGYTKAVKALQTVASIVVLGAQTANTFAAIVEGPTLNDGAGATTAGTFGALKDALIDQIGGVAANYTIETSATLNGDGTFTFA